MEKIYFNGSIFTNNPLFVALLVLNNVVEHISPDITDIEQIHSLNMLNLPLFKELYQEAKNNKLFICPKWGFEDVTEFMKGKPTTEFYYHIKYIGENKTIYDILKGYKIALFGE